MVGSQPSSVIVKQQRLLFVRERGGEMGTGSESAEFGRHIFDESTVQRLNSTNPLRIAVAGAGGGRSRSQQQFPPAALPIPAPARTSTSYDSRSCTDRFFLFLFILHAVAAVGLVSYLNFRGFHWLIKAGEAGRKENNLLQFFLPQAGSALVLSTVLAFAWQKTVREWPNIMFPFILWGSVVTSLSAGILLLCLQNPATDGLGVALLAFSVGDCLYACSVVKKITFSLKVMEKSLEPASRFSDLNRPVYGLIIFAFLWMSLWIVAVIGAVDFYVPPLVMASLVLSMAWATELMRNVADLTVSRVISLYYLRNAQIGTRVCFVRALTQNLGSACLGSLFVPTIEALRIVARALNLLEGEDEFMFSCAHCCLGVMETIFRYGNAWAFVQVAAHGKNFVRASKDTWELFQKQEMEEVVNSDITGSLGFLAGVCSGCICVIVAAAWTAVVRRSFVATISLLAFFIGYLMTRIGMAVMHALVSCYYVCYAMAPNGVVFEHDKTIPDKLVLIKSGRDIVVSVPRVPRLFR